MTLGRTGYIYTLTDPRTDEVRYVGRTVQPHQRLYFHLNDPHTDRVETWINELQENGLEPEMYLIDVAKEGVELRRKERKAVPRLAAEHDLFNKQLVRGRRHGGQR